MTSPAPSSRATSTGPTTSRPWRPCPRGWSRTPTSLAACRRPPCPFSASCRLPRGMLIRLQKEPLPPPRNRSSTVCRMSSRCFFSLSYCSVV
ncbi:hypothetical protein B296_00038913 [Ensete ventricosum]|uniref:Uncharacterized protein n=1 Tax=Ensete ventricosum TaxID=4639 RepID=A0A426ZUZ9_ENSVE|nr:hypothetical protein B296_00038913 [Ensete ventricosum]